MRNFIIVVFCIFVSLYQIPDVLAAQNPTIQNTELSMPVGLTLSIIPGFGMGNYYAKNYPKGITFTLLDSSLTGISLWAYTSTKVTDYSVISIGVIPAILLFFKIIQIKTTYDDIESYNSRYLFKKP